METRYSLLTPAFLKLLRDDSKWVGVGGVCRKGVHRCSCSEVCCGDVVCVVRC